MRQIGVFGSAIGNHSKEDKASAVLVGQLIAEKKCVLITGATFGLPNEAVRGAHSKDGLTIGISPASNIKDHTGKYDVG